MSRLVVLVAAFGMAGTVQGAGATDYRCREIDGDWVWFSDHAVSSIQYIVIGPQGRRYEVGTGVMLAGAPRGWRAEHSGSVEITAWGIGAFHARKADDGGPFKLCVGEGNLDPITIYKKEF